MTDLDAYRLLHGPYKPPALRVGDRTVCLARDCDVKIRGGGSGILVEEELARAVRCESALAIGYWWGAICKTVAWWRRALGVDRMDSEGSRRLILAGIDAKAQKLRGRTLPPDQVERRRQTAIKLQLGKNLERFRRPGGRPWTAEELAALGTAPDAELAARFQRTEGAIRMKRERLGIDRAPGDNARRPWEAWEDELVLRLSAKEAAGKVGRTATAVYQRRLVLRQEMELER